jgi:hypothetical protein
MKQKKRLTQVEEFEILKLVLDKFLWLGVIIMGFGLYKLIMNSVTQGVSFIFAGIVVLTLFVFLIIKEYEMLK